MIFVFIFLGSSGTLTFYEYTDWLTDLLLELGRPRVAVLWAVFSRIDDAYSEVAVVEISFFLTWKMFPWFPFQSICFWCTCFIMISKSTITDEVIVILSKSKSHILDLLQQLVVHDRWSAPPPPPPPHTHTHTHTLRMKNCLQQNTCTEYTIWHMDDPWWARWTNEHDTAHFQTKTIPIT